ncbi:MAG: cyclohexanecarboxyl-CoA dehydrogenase [Rhodospirillaceae bacterium]|jgi:cyclohexanecarboxyl-CoA dehydrogenase|nr:cyclohexanecarboxyl-CoA dehydrogenase [Rhodospirillaceae bacterium]MBT6137482.1 cyclohexanecarboxyl-CoA dehydrogenase [Rhodospirillaceae bacterium]
MDFAFTSEQEAIRETAARFAADRLAPGYMERDRDAGLPRDLVAEMGALGLIGVELPESHGGLGLDGVTAGIVVEELSRADLNITYVQVLGALVGSILVRHGDPALADRIVPELCRGGMLAALALTEPGGGSDAANLRMKAVRTNQGYVLDGEKTSISMADKADAALVFARTGTTEEKAHGVTAFWVELDAPGVSRTAFDDLGARMVGRGSIFLDGVVVPDTARVGGEGEGFRQVMSGFDYSRALIGLQVIAAARASLDEAWSEAGEREAFGRPIGANQGVSFPLAEAETMLTAARLLCYRTLWLRDQGLPHTSEAAMCKWWAPKLAFDVIRECLLVHGHSGYSKDTPHQQRLRDVLGLQIGDGTAQIQKLVIARKHLGRDLAG